MSIYLYEPKGKGIVSGFEKKIRDHRVPSAERIGMLWNRLSEGLAASKSISSSSLKCLVLYSLQELGLNSQDLSGVRDLFSLIQDPAVLGGGRKRLILEQVDQPEEGSYSSGVFRILNKKGSTVAIFKPSLKRAENELAVRSIAVMLGLSDCAVPGIFCTLQGPFPVPQEEKNSSFSQAEEKAGEDVESLKKPEKKEKSESFLVFDGEDLARELQDRSPECFEEKPSRPKSQQSYFEISEELYCGMIKTTQVRCNQKNQLLSGILEPFVNVESTAYTLLSFVKMTMLAAIAGFRDAKGDGYVNGVWIDYEENMPASLELSMTSLEDMNTNVAQLHLPYLESELTKGKLKGEDLKILQTLVMRWDLQSIVEKVRALTMHFYDREAESIAWAKNSCTEKNSKLLGEDEDEELEEIFLGRGKPAEKGEFPTEREAASFAVSSMECAPERKKLFPSRNVIEESKETNDQVAVYLPSQIQAFEERLRRVHDVILRADLEEGISALDIVFAADPLYMAQYQSITDPNKKFVGTRREEQAFQALARNPFLRLGTVSPVGMHSPISFTPPPMSAPGSSKGSPSTFDAETPRASPPVMSPRSPLSLRSTTIRPGGIRVPSLTTTTTTTTSSAPSAWNPTLPFFERQLPIIPGGKKT